MIKFTCLGRSTQPIKNLLLDAKKAYLTAQNSMTVIRRHHSERPNGWLHATTRPSRPMSTLALDETQKTLLLNDINQFLHPASRRWYANRGIPYRRGYLFHG